jgi:tRNA pseudouridine55 synthase
MNSICGIYKPKGWSSYDVIRRLKKETGIKKIGHGGTLDPFAEGVLVVGIGREGTKQLGTILKNTLKTYQGVIVFGASSTTDDLEGVITQQENFLMPSKEAIEEACKKFIGEIWQTPPIYSAVKLQGQPAYKRVRRGEEVVLQPKQVVVKEIKVLEYNPPRVKVEVTCGSGVYIRALARDIAESLGTKAYLSELVRTRIWNQEVGFDISNCLILQNHGEVGFRPKMGAE